MMSIQYSSYSNVAVPKIAMSLTYPQIFSPAGCPDMEPCICYQKNPFLVQDIFAAEGFLGHHSGALSPWCALPGLFKP